MLQIMNAPPQGNLLIISSGEKVQTVELGSSMSEFALRLLLFLYVFMFILKNP